MSKLAPHRSGLPADECGDHHVVHRHAEVGGSKAVASTTDGIEVSADVCPPSFLATSCWAS